VAVVSAKLYANRVLVYLATYKWPHLASNHSIFTGRMFFLTLNQQSQCTAGMYVGKVKSAIPSRWV